MLRQLTRKVLKIIKLNYEFKAKTNPISNVQKMLIERIVNP